MTEQEFQILKRNFELSIAALAPVPAKPPVVRSGYRSKTEERYAEYLALMQKAGEILDWRYEPVTFHLAPRCSYKPDFWVMRSNGVPVYREVKGRKRDSFWSMPVSKVKIRFCAATWPVYRFEIVWPSARLGEWSSMVVPSGKAEVR